MFAALIVVRSSIRWTSPAPTAVVGFWYDFLERLGYYVPYEKRTEKNDWYGKDMVLDNEQAKQLVDYAVKKEVYNWDGVESVVATALMHENKVVINANW